MHKVLVALSLMLIVACNNPRELTGPTRCFDFQEEIQPLLLQRCGECHAVADPEAGFRIDSYQALLAPDSEGVLRAIPGESQSRLLARIAGEGGHPRTFDEETQGTLGRWIVDCRMSYFANGLVHPEGWVHPDESSFHGKELEASGWDLESCVACHGEGDDPMGGGTRLSCTRCHQDGPTGCDTCHGADGSAAPPRSLDGKVTTNEPGVGAHQIHLEGGTILGITVDCEECHQVPTDWQEVGHLTDSNGAPDNDGRAEVVFGPIASQSVVGHESRRVGPPTYDYDSQTCTNVYCHAGALADRGRAIWTDLRDGADGCATCHGTPPGGGVHPGTLEESDCVTCHGLVVNSALDLVDASLHLDGAMSLGDGSGTCSACHGSVDNAAPPTGLHGETQTGDLAVGAHQSHLAAGTFRHAMDCVECHSPLQGGTVAEQIAAPTHLDNLDGAEVFPAGFGGLGARDEAPVQYSSGTCTDAYCHGGGTLPTGDGLIYDTSPSVNRIVDWTDVGNGTIVCGSCHGIPPTVGTAHGVFNQITDCPICHALVVDDAGNILDEGDPPSIFTGLSGQTTKHINGRTDFSQ